MTRTPIVISCFNEAQRLPVADFEKFAAGAPNVGFLRAVWEMWRIHRRCLSSRSR